MMLDKKALEHLSKSKNLLAFSGGVDSSALYHLLLKNDIDFDIALVNYQTREQSFKEEAYAYELANRDKKKAFIERCELEENDFEHKARKFRYAFFHKIISTHGYESLITAHQLDDLLEWGLMQLCKGCGVVEFVGMQPIEKQEFYTLVRPVLYTPKKELAAFLQKNNFRFFIDSSNMSDIHTRNRFRKEAAAFLMNENAKGIANSFKYMQKDKETLLPPVQIIFQKDKLITFKRPSNDSETIRQIDKTIKQFGYLLSKAQKDEIMRCKSCVISAKWCIEVEDTTVWIAPIANKTMPKPFKELCRKNNIPKKIRPYLYSLDALDELFSALKD